MPVVRRPPCPPPRFLLAASLAVFALAAARGVPAAPQGAGGEELVDRIVAVVGEETILESDLAEVVGLGLAQRRAGEAEDEFRTRVVDDIVRERLRFHEVDRFGLTQVPVGDIERQVAAIRERLGGAEPFARKLRELRTTEDELRQLVARQLMVLTYVDERLGARVFVGLDEIRAYYDDTLRPRLEAERQPVPPLDEVRESIRALLREQRLNEEIVRWTEDLRRDADVQLFLDEPRELPPVVSGTSSDRPPHP